MIINCLLSAGQNFKDYHLQISTRYGKNSV